MSEKRTAQVIDTILPNADTKAGRVLATTALALAVGGGVSSAEAKTIRVNDNKEKYTLVTSEKIKKGKNSATITERARITGYDDKGDDETVESSATSTTAKEPIVVKFKGMTLKEALAQPEVRRAINKDKAKVRREALKEAREQDKLEEFIIDSKTIDKDSPLAKAIEAQMKLQNGEQKASNGHNWEQGKFIFENGEEDLTIAYVDAYKKDGAVNTSFAYETVEEGETDEVIFTRLIGVADQELKKVSGPQG